MQPLHDYWFNLNRRQLLTRSAAGGLSLLGHTALHELLAEDTKGAAGAKSNPPAAAIQGQAAISHFAPKAKRVIYLHMEGAPSQVDTFDYKPDLADLFNKDMPDSIRGNQRLTGMTAKSPA